MRFTRLALVILAVIAAATSYGVGLYTQSRESEVKKLIAQIEDDRQALHVLEAELAYLSRPQRLQELASQHLNLRPVFPDQIYDNIYLLPPVGGFAHAAEVKTPESEEEHPL